MEYNYFSSYGDYGSPTTLIPKKTVDDLTANAPKELDTFKEVADKINSIEGGGSGSSEQIEALSQTVGQNKADADAKFEEIDSALETKADASALEDLATKDEVENLFASVEYDDSTKKITFKNSEGTIVGEVDATDFIKDGMVNGVSVENGKLVISFNEDGGDETVELDITEIFNAENYYTKAEADAAFQPIGDYQAAGDYALASDIPDLEGYATTQYVDGKVGEIVVPTNLSELTNDDNYVQDENYVHTDNNYTTEEKNKLESLNNYDDTELAGRVTALEAANYVEDANYVHTDNNYTSEDKAKLVELQNYDDSALAERVTTLENADYVQDANYVHTDNNFTDELKTKLEGLSEYDDTALDGRVEALENAGYLTTLTGDARYYEREAVDNIFVSKSQYEDDIELKADKSELVDYATDSDLESAVRELVVRLNKLEAQNAILVEKGTDSADEITGMSENDALNADIVVATNEAIEALSTPKTFNSISVAGGEVGGNTVINLLATDSIDVNGLTVSGTKGTGNGKIIFGSNDVTISNLNIEQGCTVYNVFEGKQDKAAENCIDNFTATNIIVDDTDLAHNVFNIYQVNDGANILIKDSVFNLNVANSNVMRMSNITNAKNVTITFENVDWNYENKPYSESDVDWAGLMIYQPYGYDSAFTGDTSNIQTWIINVKNCRYNGEHVMSNNFGTIKQAIYLYNVNGSNAAEAPDTIFTVNFE